MIAKRQVMGTLIAAVLLAACASSGASSGNAPSASPSPSPSPSLSPRDQLDQLLNDDPGLLQAICNEADHLVSVGWPEEMIPTILSGDIPMLDKHDVKKLEATGVELKKAIVVALERCP